MADHFPFPSAALDVPLIGQPFKVVAHYPTVVIQCQCEAKHTIVLIGTKSPNACPACLSQYAIVDEMEVRVAQGPKLTPRASN